MAKSEPNLNVNSISRISAGTVIKGEIMSPTVQQTSHYYIMQTVQRHISLLP